MSLTSAFPRFLLAAFFFVSPMFGQTQKARITGTITDASGAAVPNARIIATHIATGAQRTATSGEAGMYTLPVLDPGDYEIGVEKEGFQKLSRKGVSLRVSDSVTLDLALQVGAVGQTLTVTGESPLLQTSEAAQGAVIDNSKVDSLPLNGRSSFRLANLTPGFNGTLAASGQFGDVPVNTTWDANFSINGAQGYSNEIHIDGVPSTAGFFNQITTMPSVDALEEFKVQSGSLSSEYGRLGGGVLNVSTKSGTNEFHGSLFEFLRNSALDANDFFNNRAGRPIPPFRMNQFGGSIGGPMILPKLYNGKNRTFFFFNYEATRWSRGDVATLTLPTELQRQGDFSRTLAQNGDLVVIYDPLTTRPDPANPGRHVRTPFSGNRLPANRINSVGRNITGFYPKPNTPGNPVTGTNNYINNSSRTIDKGQINFRIDHSLTQNNQFLLRYSQDDTDLCQPDTYGNPATPGAGGVGCTTWNNKSATVQDTHTLGPATLLNVRYGFARWYQIRAGHSFGFDAGSLGFPRSLVNSIQYRLFPDVTVQGYGGLGAFGNMYFENGNDNHSLLATVTHIRGAHNWKFGSDVRVGRINNLQAQFPSGSYSFTRAFTQGPDPTRTAANAGDGFASLLLGYPNGGQISSDVGVSLQNWYVAGFVQDDIRLHQKFTLNLGLRYETESPYTERRNMIAGFDADLKSPAANSAFPNLSGGLFFAGAGARHVYRWDKVNFAPRAGFAWQAGGRTVVRAGAGVFFAPLQISPNAVGFSPSPGFSATTGLVSSLDGGRTPFVTLANPFPDGFVPPTGNNLGAGTFLGQALTVWDKNADQPYALQWNVAIQRQLPGSLVVDIAYVANSGVKLARPRQMNALPTQFLALNNQLLEQVDNPFRGAITGGAMGQARVIRSRLLRPFPQFEGVNILNSTSGHSSYHSLQFKAERRFRTGLSLLASYTAAKQISDTSWAVSGIGPDNGSGAFQDWYNLRLERAIAAQDVSQTFVFNATYNLPFGKGKPVGSRWSGAMQWLAANWQVNGILTLAAGNPLDIVTQVNNTNSLGGGSRPNNKGSSARIEGSRSTHDRISRWFDTDVFSQPDPFTFGNTSRTLPDVRQPGVANVDLSLFKNIPITEKVNLQFRSEFFNAFNNANFASPNLNFGARDFGVINGTARLPRVIQFALKLRF